MEASTITSPEGSEFYMNFGVGRKIATIGILTVLVSLFGCSRQHKQITSNLPSPQQALQQSSPAESPPVPKAKETKEQTSPGSEQAATANGGIVEVNQADFEQEVIQADMPVVVTVGRIGASHVT